MPAYNAAAYLEEALNSILGQTFRDFEFIAINHGSTDDTDSILTRYQKLDARLQVYYGEERGLASALNLGCRLARGKYIARMDADDISSPLRFEKQLEYIERHSQIGILGTWICKVDEHGAVKGAWRPPTNPKVLKWMNFFGVCVSHSSVLIRRQVLEDLNFYRPHALHSEDVDLWLRASSITEFGNVPEILNKYRVWDASTHQRYLQLRSAAHIQLLASYIGNFLKIDSPIEAVAGLRQTRVGPPANNPKQIRLTAALIERLYEKFVSENNLTSEERQDISWDAAKRVASLALQASRFDKPSSVSLLMDALKLDSRLLYPSVMVKGLRRAVRERPSDLVPLGS